MSDHGKMIEEIELAVEEEGFDLTEWEDEFIQSIREREELTERQDEVLVKIWKKATRRKS